MKEEQKIKALKQFQKDCFKAYKTLGFSQDNCNTIFSIIIEMRNIVVSAETQDTILLHIHMGLCAEALANYATVNSIDISKHLANFKYDELEYKTNGVDLEFYLEKIRDDLSFVKDMTDEEKIEFIQKCWISIFIDDYHNEFLKIDRILKTTIENNKTKYPKIYLNN